MTELAQFLGKLIRERGGILPSNDQWLEGRAKVIEDMRYKKEYQPRVADYEDFREWKDEKSNAKVAIADLETPQDPILIRLDRIYDLLLEFKNILTPKDNAPSIIEVWPTCPPQIVRPWYRTDEVTCTETTNTQDDENE